MKPDIKQIAKWLLIIGGSGFAISYGVGYVEGKKQNTATPVLPAWYTSTLGRVDGMLPTPGTFGWTAIAGAVALVASKYVKK